MGLAYKALTQNEAWQDLAGRLFAARDDYYAMFVSGDWDDPAKAMREQAYARAGIKLVEWLLTIPADMILQGKDSEQELRRRAAERNGNG